MGKIIMEGYCTGFNHRDWVGFWLLLHQHVNVIPGIGKYANVKRKKKHAYFIMPNYKGEQKHLELFLF